ncbi:molybdopterin-dependent oxidoreductase [Candidatus Latescibacterota bacterium]
MKKITITINRKKIATYSGKTILEVVNENNIDKIPTLCYDKRLEPYGSCFMCVVEVEGFNKLVPSCCTPVDNGMKIQTNNERIQKSRKTALELLLSNHYADCIGPCKISCPAGVDVQGYISLISMGKHVEALRLIKQNNPLPSICGRICVSECEINCRRNNVDEPLAIKDLKRYVADIDMSDPWKPEINEKINKKVAVIGGGPAGLTCAYYLTVKGCAVTIFEKMPLLGGMLRYGIPEYRLPKNILDKETDWLFDLGINVRLNSAIGGDVTVQKLLKDGYDAVYLSVGASASRHMGINGEHDTDGIIKGLDFLRDIEMRVMTALEGTVIVVGGGNTAIDAARSAMRLGAEHVKVVYRRSVKEMPAHPIEINAAREEGIEFEFLTVPKSILKSGKKLTGIECLKMKLKKAKPHERPRPMPILGSEFVIHCDYLITAIGQGVDDSFFDNLQECEKEKWGTIKVDVNTLNTSIEGVFAGGDAVTGPSTAISAVVQGSNAAKSIYDYLTNSTVNGTEKRFISSKHKFAPLTDSEFVHIEKTKRQKMPELKCVTRKQCFDEVELGYSDEQALHESQRCIECGCSQYHNCVLRKYADTFGVDISQYLGEFNKYGIDNRHPFISLDSNKCINCGRCVRTCSEILKISAIGFVNRGFRSIVKPALEKPLLETNCISCGNCIDACPTGALSEKYIKKGAVTLKSEDCESICHFCSLGCKINYKVIDEDIFYVSNTSEDSFVSHNKGYLCAKGRFGHRYLLMKERLKEPVLKHGSYPEKIGWDEAISYTGKRLKDIISMYGADSIALFGSPKLSNEDLYLLQKMGRGCLGTNNVSSFSNLLNGYDQNCLDESFGQTVSNTTIDEIEKADIIVAINLGVSEDNLITELKIKKAQKRGARFILINSSEIKLSKFADLWIDTRRGTNTVLLNGILRELIHNDKTDKKFAERNKNDYLALQKMVDVYTPLKVESLTGVEHQKYSELINLLGNPDKKQIFIYNIDSLIEKSKNDLKAIGNYLLLTDRIKRKGNGLILLRNSSNSNGLMDMGITPKYLPGYVKYHEDEKIERMSQIWGIDLKKIFKPVDILQKMLRNEIKAVLIFGEDPLVYNENRKYFDGVEFSLVCDMFPTTTAKEADIVLPASAYIEQEGTFTSSDLRIQKVNKIMNPKNGLENYKIIERIARIFDDSLCYETQEQVFKEIQQVIPFYKDCHIGESWVKNLDIEACLSFYDIDLRTFHQSQKSLLYSEQFFETKVRSMIERVPVYGKKQKEVVVY